MVGGEGFALKTKWKDPPRRGEMRPLFAQKATTIARNYSRSELCGQTMHFRAWYVPIGTFVHIIQRFRA